MLTLVLEQSTAQGSAAILKHEQLLVECTWEADGRHSQQIFGAVAALLERGRLRPGDLAQYIVGLGPGSYTGLRIGLAFVNGLAAPAERPVFGLPSAAATASLAAARFPDVTTVQVVGDARRGRLWVGTFQVSGGSTVRQAGEFTLIGVADATAALHKDAVVATAEWDRLSTVLPDCVPDPSHLIRETLTPTAATLGLLGLEWEASGQPSTALEPIYLHPPVFSAPAFVRTHGHDFSLSCGAGSASYVAN